MRVCSVVPHAGAACLEGCSLLFDGQCAQKRMAAAGWRAEDRLLERAADPMTGACRSCGFPVVSLGDPAAYVDEVNRKRDAERLLPRAELDRLRRIEAAARDWARLPIGAGDGARLAAVMELREALEVDR